MRRQGKLCLKCLKVMRMLGKVKNKLKKVFKRDKKKYGMPREYIMVKWRDEAKNHRIGGKAAKEIVWMENGKGKKTYPYSNARLKSMKQNLKLPVWDKTGGRNKPDIELEDRIDPGKIEYRSW